MNSETGYFFCLPMKVWTELIFLQMIAKHVMNIHMNRPNNSADENGDVVGEIDIDRMKRYISYCKSCVLV